MKNKVSESRMKELLNMKLWGIEQVAEYLNMTVASVRNMSTRGEIPGLKRLNSKKWFIHVDEFVEWFKENKKREKPKKSIFKGQRV